MLVSLLSVALVALIPDAHPAEPADFVFAPPAGTRFVDATSWCTEELVERGGACVEGVIADVHTRISLSSHAANEGPTYDVDGGYQRQPACFDLINSWGYAAAYDDGGVLCAVDTSCEPESADPKKSDCSAPFHGRRVWYRSFEGRGVLVEVLLDDAPDAAQQKALAAVRAAILSIKAREHARFMTREIAVPLPKGAALLGWRGDGIRDGAYMLTWGTSYPSVQERLDDLWTHSITTAKGAVIVATCSRADRNSHDTAAQAEAKCVRLLDGVTAR